MKEYFDKELSNSEPKEDPLSKMIKQTVNELLNGYNAGEQKEFLLAVRGRLIDHYGKLKDDHITQAEELSKHIEYLNN